jgi:undecaprenyl-diphosphatase
MAQQNKRKLCLSLCLLSAFALWTLLVGFVDVQAIGPEGSSVGFAALNGRFHALTGVHMALYTVTDWLGLVPLAFVMGFALLGLAQWVKRKQLFRVDRSILVLGGFYLVTMAAYLLFETVIINYRPILIGGNLEASYPSSTTVLSMTVMPTAILQLRTRLKRKDFKECVTALIAAFTAFMVIGRLLSGVHWLTDIVGGALLSAGLVVMYDFLSRP